MTVAETKTAEAIEMASAYTYLAIAKNHVQDAIIRLKHTDIEDMEEDLWDVYGVLDRMVIKLHRQSRR